MSRFRNIPLHDTQQIEDLKYLEENWQIIRDEAIALTEEGKQVRLINKTFEKVYGVRRISRRIKKWNKPFYVYLKYDLRLS